METMWVYERTESNLYTVGFYDSGSHKWHTDSDHRTREEAAARAHHLNGGNDPGMHRALAAMLDAYAPYADWKKPEDLHPAVLAAGRALGKL